MQAIILAAGMGTRFGKMTESIPKGMIPVNGKPMIIQSIDKLQKAGVEKIIIGTGYHREIYDGLASRYHNVETCFSLKYASTNSMYTLYNSRESLNDDFLLLESDIIYNQQALDVLIDSKYKNAMLVTPVRKFQDQYYVEYDRNDVLTNCSTNKNALHYGGEMVGIHKLSRSFFRKMCEDYASQIQTSPKLGYEFELLRISRMMMPLHVVMDNDVHWYEIDDEKDLIFAKKHVAKYC